MKENRTLYQISHKIYIYTNPCDYCYLVYI